MAHSDYSDDDDYYAQGFEREGVVSIWVGVAEVAGCTDTDVLQDLCGVGYYNLDNQEANARPAAVPVEVLLGEISYSATFLSQALKSASELGVSAARWVIVQFDFGYDPSRVSRPVAADPLFLGVFTYATI